MVKQIVIDFTEDGKAEAMHFDEFPLKFLGKMQVTRASDILWDPEEEGWYIQLPNTTLRMKEWSGFASYEEAREFEVEWLQLCRMKGYLPNSLIGWYISSALRKGRLETKAA